MLYRIGTRSSELALKQTSIVIDKLKEIDSSFEFDIVKIKSTGDKDQTTAISELGVDGVFVKELESALIAKEVDFVVHSLKDLPTVINTRCAIASILERKHNCDVLISHNTTFQNLAPHSIVGTSSIRRTYQLRNLRNDLTYRNIRGNVPTRIKKFENGEYDAIVLAGAGLMRLGLEDRITQTFSYEELIPAAGQGALAVECLGDNTDLMCLLKKIDDINVRAQCNNERVFLARLGGGCTYPIGVVSWSDTDEMHILGSVNDLHSQNSIKEKITCSLDFSYSNPGYLGNKLADLFIEKGALSLLQN